MIENQNQNDPSPQMDALTESIKIPKNYSIKNTIKHIIGQYKERDPFYITHLSNIESQYKRWFKNFPNIHPYYAVKSNPDHNVVKYLSSLGANFDCASMREIQDVISITKDPNRIIFANTIKFPQHLEYAASVGIDKVTADNVSELEKHLFITERLKY